MGICPEYWREVPGILVQEGITFPVLRDPGARVTAAYELSDHLRYPFTVFVSPEGRVVGAWGSVLRDLEQLLGLLGRAGLRPSAPGGHFPR